MNSAGDKSLAAYYVRLLSVAVSQSCRARATNDHLYDLQRAQMKGTFVGLTASTITQSHRFNAHRRLSSSTNIASWTTIIHWAHGISRFWSLFVSCSTAMTVQYEIVAICVICSWVAVLYLIISCCYEFYSIIL